ncbi:hypothetical protein OPV22_025537 [Ensete ventricosum]|uniref:Uncharacterized protein n=1 Tax=Ensete ventricosum TaxID=4639 RepID=A0AAV8Q416_ENSVE|nr:hypothetical protein OPV22_025537 [Ensete ventricosum]
MAGSHCGLLGLPTVGCTPCLPPLDHYRLHSRREKTRSCRTWSSWHHRLLVTYSFAGQYNHPVEGFLGEQPSSTCCSSGTPPPTTTSTIQFHGDKYNSSLPFFVTRDKILGTHTPYILPKRACGGVQIRLAKD